MPTPGRQVFPEITWKPACSVPLNSFERVPMKNELNQTALMLLGKACLHGLVSEEHLFQKLGNDSSFKSITSVIPEEAPLEHSRQIRN